MGAARGKGVGTTLVAVAATATIVAHPAAAAAVT